MAKSHPWESKLTIIVEGIKSTKGDIKVSVQNKPDVFNTKAGIEAGRNRVLKINNETTQYSFNKLHHGEYAIAVFHDENKNDRLDLDLFDSPMEGYGFSRNPKVQNRAPTFSEASFKFNSNVTIRVKLNYLNSGS